MANPLVQAARQPLKMSHRLLIASLAASVLGVIGLPSSLIPEQMPLVTMAAIAQTEITAEEIIQYARAVLEIDSYRTEAYTKIKDLLLTVDTDVSEIGVSCSNTQNISNVPRSVRREVQDILVGYCNQAQDVVEANGLTSRRFNEITAEHQNDESLFQRIQQELIRLQQPQ
ncbi:MAG: DUF4168 domain-containing protein [Leptolyngbya sp. SIO1D8]|nr:DUF4168 domain-containing protein [Leptolyngbya sp. SIO1D8]